MLQEKLQQAQQNLESFVGANPKAAEAPDALFKLGLCQTRLAVLNAQPQERNKALAVRAEDLRSADPAVPAGAARRPGRHRAGQVLALHGRQERGDQRTAPFTTDPLQQIAASRRWRSCSWRRCCANRTRPRKRPTSSNAARQRHEPDSDQGPARTRRACSASITAFACRKPASRRGPRRARYDPARWCRASRWRSRPSFAAASAAWPRARKIDRNRPAATGQPNLNPAAARRRRTIC